MTPEAEETWPPAPATAREDNLHFRTRSLDLTIAGDILMLRLTFIRGFVIRFAWAIALVIPLLLLAPFVDNVRSGGASIVPQLGSALRQRAHEMVPFIGVVLANLGFLWLIFETMLLRGAFRFDRNRRRLRAGLWPYSLRGLAYVAVRSQISRTKTWTRWCFYLGFDFAAAPTFDRFNPLHRLVALYGEAKPDEYYLGYVADRDAAVRAGEAIAEFVDVEFRFEE